MCNTIGVDPLAGSNVKGSSKGKSWWAQMLGGDVNDFYFELAVRVVEVCRAGRGGNGGLMGVRECREKVARGRGIGGGMDISDDDVLRAVESLKPLGSGFSIVSVGSKQMIRSIPKELSRDQSTVLEAVQICEPITCSVVVDNLGWEDERAETVLDDLLADSLLWVDEQCEEKEFWLPPAFIDDDDG